jgi:protein tyrosine kinase modulator
MLPGKKYRPEDLLAMLRRRFWLLIVPFAIVSALTAAVARKLPDRYRSEAVIIMVPQQISDSYVRPATVSRLEDQLQAIANQILSRTQLEKTIEKFNLYPDERQTGIILEDLVENMRNKDIQVKQVAKANAFSVAYMGPSRTTVQKVTEHLAGAFIQAQFSDQQGRAESATQFLQATVEDARRKLIDSEQKLEAYRRHFSGQLPEQVDANIQKLTNTMQRVSSIDQTINADRNQRLLLEQRLKDLEDDASKAAAADTAAGAVVQAPGVVTGGSFAQQLAVAQNQVTALKATGKTDLHPEVKAWNRMIESVMKQAEAEALERPLSTSDGRPAVPPAELARQKQVQDVKSRIEELDRQIAANQVEGNRLMGSVNDLTKRIDAAPTRQSEMTELMRDYTTLQQSYAKLRASREDQSIAANLQSRQIGEQYRLLDPARVPQRPFSPDRTAINIGGMVAGLALGVGLILLIEYRDSSFKTDDEVTRLLSLPVLAVVPQMESDEEGRRARRRRWIVGLGLGSTVTGCFAVLIYTFVR